MPTPSKRQLASRNAAVSARRAAVVAQLGSALAPVIPAVPLPSPEQLVANAVQGRRTCAATAQTSTVAAALASAVEEGTPLLHLNAAGAVALDLELAAADVKALSAVCKAQLARPPERDHFTRLGWKIDPLFILGAHRGTVYGGVTLVLTPVLCAAPVWVLGACPFRGGVSPSIRGPSLPLLGAWSRSMSTLLMPPLPPGSSHLRPLHPLCPHRRLRPD